MISALIFDKDGTLFDFHASWGGWVRRLLPHIARRPQDEPALLQALGYDLAAGRFHKSSTVIAGTPQDIAACLVPLVPHLPPDELIHRINQQAGLAPMIPAVDLAATLGQLRGRGLALGLATNDAEAPAREHLARAGVLELFDFIAGSDSGHGAKPAPGQLLAFARQIATPPQRIAMVGDSLHDLHAARAAGMAAVAVLTGVAEAADLAPAADIVLPDIGHIPAWLDNLRP
jgi:phosphoglycolate phosphatase